MKASRLLHLLLLLQTRQRITTSELAERLEVSRRTVLRDVESLSAAGVPVYAERGRSGGIVLLPDARLNVSHLDPPELEALSVVGLDGAQLERLGLATVRETASRKIAARQSAAPGPTQLARLADLVLVESTAWFSHTESAVGIADLASALRRRRRLRIRYRRSAESGASDRVVDPHGLVAKAGRWYLVAEERGEGRLFSVERLSAVEELEEQASLRPGATLRSEWVALKGRTEERGSVRITARLPESGVDLARRILGTRLREVSAAEDGMCTIVVAYHDLEAVRQLLQFGDHIEVLAPAAARRRVGELARDLAQRHAAPTA